VWMRQIMALPRACLQSCSEMRAGTRPGLLIDERRAFLHQIA
jgi:hypothetical protein